MAIQLHLGQKHRK